MAGWDSIRNCSLDLLDACSSNITCGVDLEASFHKSMRHKIWRMDALLLVSVILAGAIVGIGTFGQRIRHHGFTRLIFLGATTLFLPVVSTVVSMGTGSNDYVIEDSSHSLIGSLTAKCEHGPRHSFLVLVWAFLIQIIMINTSAIIAVDEREGRNKVPPFELLVQVLWTFYLGVSYLIVTDLAFIYSVPIIVIISFFLTCAKMVIKYYAFEKARKSFALGRNPRINFEYMKQLKQQETNYHGERPTVVEDVPPPLLVMGEEKRHMVKRPHGYVIKDDLRTMLHEKTGFVTIDKVWKMDNIFPVSTMTRLKDLCLSFALFKLLRCRFARYNIANAAGSKDNFTFFWTLLLKKGGHERVFQMISDEVSFVHDYYYSSITISYSKCWLPIVGIFISLLSIAYCIIVGTMLLLTVASGGKHPQILCIVRCTDYLLVNQPSIAMFGKFYFVLGPVFLVFVLVVIAELREITSFICSNWTKVAIVCHLLNCASSQHYLCMHKLAGLLLHHRCRLIKHWDHQIGQCSVLVLRPRTTPLGFLGHLFHLPDHKRKVKVPAVVKVCIMQVVRRSRNGHLTNGTACLSRQGQVGERFLWACNNESTSYTILVWHIATSILEVRHMHLHGEEQGSSPISHTKYKIAASHLSRYCAYLVTWSPELLPDDDTWSRSLYEDVKKDAERVLSNCTVGHSLVPEAECKQLIETLSANAKHDVLKEGARLGEQLVQLMVQGEDATAWKLLAKFWSGMILYVASSDNLKGHKQAIARGGELITLLWVLLFHAGIVSRPSEEDNVPATYGGVV